MVVFAIGECKHLQAQTGAGGSLHEALNAHDVTNNLGDDGRGYRFCVWACMSIHVQTVNEGFVASNVPAYGAETFCECAHEDINPTGVDTKEAPVAAVLIHKTWAVAI